MSALDWWITATLFCAESDPNDFKYSVTSATVC